jgi:hypothetical protein
MILGKQLWVGHEKTIREKPLSEEHIQPVGEGHLGIKGKGGLWTSTYLGNDLGSDWIQWCLANEFGLPKDNIYHGYILEPKDNLMIYTIDSLEDMHILFDEYGYKMYPVTEMEGIDWQKMAEDFDALHLTSNGEAVTRHGFSFFRDITSELKPEWKSKTMRNFYGWDCESCFHFKWNFKKIEPIVIMAKENDGQSLMEEFYETIGKKLEKKEG